MQLSPGAEQILALSPIMWQCFAAFTRLFDADEKRHPQMRVPFRRPFSSAFPIKRGKFPFSRSYPAK